MNKKLVSSIIFTIALLTIFISLVISIFFSNYYSDWKNEPYTVTKIVDGDTIHVKGRFSEFTVRYIGIDTPETEKSNQKGDCYGEEAMDENRKLLSSNKVYLESDKEDKDRYGRDLRYVYIKGDSGNLEMVNYKLVKEGFAKKLKIEPNTKYSDKISEFEKEARKDKKGLWGKC